MGLKPCFNIPLIPIAEGRSDSAKWSRLQDGRTAFASPLLLQQLTTGGFVWSIIGCMIPFFCTFLYCLLYIWHANVCHICNIYIYAICQMTYGTPALPHSRPGESVEPREHGPSRPLAQWQRRFCRSCCSFGHGGQFQFVVWPSFDLPGNGRMEAGFIKSVKLP